jgi:chitodextrinase
VTTPITVPPSVPTGLAASSVTGTQVVLTWNASSDSCATVAGYRIYRNGVQVGTASGTSYTDTGVGGVTTYSYTVLAYDSTSAANASAQSAALSVTTAALPYQITDALGNVIAAASSLYRTSIVPAVCGTGSINGPCNYVVIQRYGSQLVVRNDTSSSPSGPWNNISLAPGYSIGSGASYMATYGTAATFGAYLPPSTPTGLTGGAVSSLQVNLSWGASSDTSGVLAGYQVFRSGSQIGTTATTSYSDTTTTCNTSYSYTVRAYDAFSPPDVSGQSAAWFVTTPITVPPSVPAGLAASSVTATQVMLTWNASSDSCATVAGYRIYRNGVQIGTSASPGYTDTGVSGGTTYSYTVAAYDSQGTPNVSAQSAALSVATAALAYQITDSAGTVIAAASALYRTSIVPAICGTGSINGPCNYVVIQRYGSQLAVRNDTSSSPSGPWTNISLAPGYSIGSGASYMATYATAAVYGQ